MNHCRFLLIVFLVFIFSCSLTEVRELDDLEYANVDGISLRLNLKLPPFSAGGSPVIIFFHGGEWKKDNKDDPGGNILAENWPEFVEQGYAVANVDYRLSGQAKFPAQIHDVKAAVRWLRANALKYNLDPDRFAAWGISAGGHLASLLGSSGGVQELEGDVGSGGYSSLVQAVVDWCGPVDPSKIIDQKDLYPEYYQAAGELLGDKPLEEYTQEEIQQLNPAKYVDQNDPPFLIMHGDQDSSVPIDQSRTLYEALQAAGVKSTLDVMEGEGHQFGEKEQRDKVAQHLDSLFK